MAALGTGLIVLIVVGVVGLFLLMYGVGVYNTLVRLRNRLENAFSQIEVELKRRYDLIPNLVETVKGYAKHEREVLEQVINLRNQAMANHGPANVQAVDETALQIGVKRLFAVAEAYPALKADAQFLALQQELANTEDRIAAARRFFNGNVREMNALAQSFPTSMVAGMAGVKPETF